MAPDWIESFAGPRFRVRDAVVTASRRGMWNPLFLFAMAMLAFVLRFSEPLSNRLFAGTAVIAISLAAGLPLACVSIVADRRYPFRDVLKATMVSGLWAALSMATAFVLRSRYWEHATFRHALDLTTDLSTLGIMGGMWAGICFFGAILFKACNKPRRF